jgi:hypothetical protein
VSLVSVTGALQTCQLGWCVGGVPLDLGPETQLVAPAADDFDADGTVETNAQELAGLVGTSVALQVTKTVGSDVVYVINGMDYRFADGTFA